jgi:hypothetical protein
MFGSNFGGLKIDSSWFWHLWIFSSRIDFVIRIDSNLKLPSRAFVFTIDFLALNLLFNSFHINHFTFNPFLTINEFYINSFKINFSCHRTKTVNKVIRLQCMFNQFAAKKLMCLDYGAGCFRKLYSIIIMWFITEINVICNRAVVVLDAIKGPH